MLLGAVEVPFLRDRVRDCIPGGLLLPQACLGEVQVNIVFLDNPTPCPTNSTQPSPVQRVHAQTYLFYSLFRNVRTRQRL